MKEELIYKFVNQSINPSESYNDLDIDVMHFAELIIEDVCKSINQLDVWMDWTQPAVGHILTDKLKKHYGIEK